MDIRILKNEENIYILEPKGSLDLYGSNQLKDHVMKLVEREIAGIIIDMKEVDTIRSAGIGALINISSTLKKLNYGLAIANTNEAVKNAMDVTHLTAYLPIVPTLKEAVNHIAK